MAHELLGAWLEERSKWVKNPRPGEGRERGNVLRLTEFQRESVRDILHTFEHGAVLGTGTARGALLADIMGAGKTVVAIAGANERSQGSAGYW